MTRDVSLLVTSGNGPAECHQAVAGVLNLMQTEANAFGLEMNLHGVASKHGFRSAVVLLHGTNAAAFSRLWIGTTQWRAKSALRPHHKRANWFIQVFELDALEDACTDIDQSDVTFESFRAGGPGGQHLNTTDSAVRATHRPTGLTAVARDQRSQHRNRALALERLQKLRSAQASAAEAEQSAQRNRLHKSLERGNPIRCFAGSGFREVT